MMTKGQLHENVAEVQKEIERLFRLSEAELKKIVDVGWKGAAKITGTRDDYLAAILKELVKAKFDQGS